MSADTLLFTTPVSRPAFDGGATVTGMKIIQAVIDPVALTCTVIVRAIEDAVVGTPHVIVVSGLTGSTTMNQLLSAVKSQVASALGVTFQ